MADARTLVIEASRGALSPAEADALAARCEGNPFLLEESARDAVAGGSLRAVPRAVRDLVQHRIARRLYEAASHFGWQLPEVFAGLTRDDTPFPIAYPTATRPQAWAAGAPVLLLQLLLGLRPNRQALRLETAAPELPAWVGGLRLSGIRAFERSWDVQVEGGNVFVRETS